jgi:hypothetical protein
MHHNLASERQASNSTEASASSGPRRAGWSIKLRKPRCTLQVPGNILSAHLPGWAWVRGAPGLLGLLTNGCPSGKVGLPKQMQMKSRFTCSNQGQPR